MKAYQKAWLAGISMAVLASTTYAEDTGPGCGLGKLIWKDNPKMVQSSLAATTNASSFSQTFGITSGTSGCTTDGVVHRDKKIDVFVASNFESLKGDVAQGTGEYLQSLMALLEVPTSKQPQFVQITQSQFPDMFRDDATAQSVTQQLQAIHQSI